MHGQQNIKNKLLHCVNGRCRERQIMYEENKEMEQSDDG
jgi:hypothetical protein